MGGLRGRHVRRSRQPGLRALTDPVAPPTSLDARLQPGRAAFNRGAFFEAHELWEDVWRDLAGDQRNLVQGLIQIAAGLHHLQRGRQRPAARLLARGVQKISRASLTLASERPPLANVDVLVRDVERLLKDLAADRATAPDALKL